MAEGWARNLCGDLIEAYSAGIERHGLNPVAVRVMAEAGVDISGQQSKLVEELPIATFDYVITLCGHAFEICPYFPGRTLHRGFPDPPLLAKDATTEEAILRAYWSVRDQIRNYVVPGLKPKNYHKSKRCHHDPQMKKARGGITMTVEYLCNMLIVMVYYPAEIPPRGPLDG